MRKALELATSAGELSPQSALERYARLYVNWSARTVAGDQRAIRGRQQRQVVDVDEGGSSCLGHCLEDGVVRHDPRGLLPRVSEGSAARRDGVVGRGDGHDPAPAPG